MEKRKEETEIDRKLEEIMERMFSRCIKDGQFTHVIGIAIECGRMDVLENAIVVSGDIPGMLKYTFQVAQLYVKSKHLRTNIIQLIWRLLVKGTASDTFGIAKCLFFLRDADTLANLLYRLLDTVDNALLAFQIAFDIYETGNQKMVNLISQTLFVLKEGKPVQDIPGEQGSPSQGPPSPLPEINPIDFQKVLDILTGKKAEELRKQFLMDRNHYDEAIMSSLKEGLPAGKSVPHEGAIWANALMNAGTTNDNFLKDNLEWVGKTSNWAKFSATSSLGLIHRGSKAEAMSILAPYLSRQQISAQPYSAGGAFYALGLIHCNSYSAETMGKLIDALHEHSQDEKVAHGVCLAIGLVGMATHDVALYQELKNILYIDSAVAGEAAGLAMGLVMLGSGNEDAINEMLQYAHETQHQKIIRALSLGLGMVMYALEEEADVLIDQMILEKDALLRYGAMYMIGYAYIGTGNSKCIRKLLHYGVSDEDDVRKAAVMNLALILCKTPDKIPKSVSLLAESYNPHVRYGAAMAIGIGCAGKGNREILNILIPMLEDPVDFVRQGVLIATSLVLLETNVNYTPKLEDVHKYMDKALKEKGEDILVKFGALIGKGLLDLGGRNCTLSMTTK